MLTPLLLSSFHRSPLYCPAAPRRYIQAEKQQGAEGDVVLYRFAEQVGARACVCGRRKATRARAGGVAWPCGHASIATARFH